MFGALNHQNNSFYHNLLGLGKWPGCYLPSSSCCDLAQADSDVKTFLESAVLLLSTTQINSNGGRPAGPQLWADNDVGWVSGMMALVH